MTRRRYVIVEDDDRPEDRFDRAVGTIGAYGLAVAFAAAAVLGLVVVAGLLIGVIDR